MNKSVLLKGHVVATIIAFSTISSFFFSTLWAEVFGGASMILKVKTLIFYLLPVLIIAMPVLASTGFRLAAKSNSGLVSRKVKRMRIIGINGILLITMAVFLYLRALDFQFDSLFWSAQMLELGLGGTNLILIGLNIRDGLRLSGKLKRKAYLPARIFSNLPGIYR